MTTAECVVRLNHFSVCMRAQTSWLTVSPHDGYIIFQDDEPFVRMTSAMWEWTTVGEGQLAAPRHALGCTRCSQTGRSRMAVINLTCP